MNNVQTQPMDSTMLTTCVVIGVIVLIIGIIALWKIFDKAGEEGWKSIIPIYNTYILFKITWGNGWYFLLLLIPIVNFIILIVTEWKLCEVFGKGAGFFIGLLLLPIIFELILAFGSAQYQGIGAPVPPAPPVE